MTVNKFLPITGSVMPRYAGVATLMRLPWMGLDDPDLHQVDIGLVGVPWDGGTTNRPGARHGQDRELGASHVGFRTVSDQPAPAGH